MSGAAEVEDDGEPFEDVMARPVETLRGQQAEAMKTGRRHRD